MSGWRYGVIILPLGSLWGIRIRINPLFFLFAGLWAFLGAPLELALLCLIVLTHEFAHGLAGRSMGLKVSEIELYPFGGVARIDELLELEPYLERRLAWAGPAANLAMAGIGITVYSRLIPGSEAALFFIRSNLILAFFNLLPALPLDGGRILRSYLSPLLGFRAATEKAALMGQLTAMLLCGAGIYLINRSSVALSMLLVGLFLFFAATREKRQAVYSFLRSLGVKEREMLKRGGLKGEQLVVLEETRLLDVFRLFSPQRYHFVRVMDHSQKFHAEITESSLIRAAIHKGLDIPIKKIL
jgi:stage IV sporulation protein FB